MRFWRYKVRGRRASALIVAMGVLTVLALLGFTFATLARTERILSRNYTDFVRARMLAASGVERAVADLRANLGRRAWGDIQDNWIYDPQTGGAGREVGDSDLRTAVSPSLKEAELTVKGASWGYSGALPGTYQAIGDVYALRIEDTSSKIWVNGPLVGNALAPCLVKMLETLGSELGVANLASRIQTGRPAGGYSTTGELELVLGDVDWKKVQPYVTVWAWVDPVTLNPAALAPQATNSPNDRWVWNGRWDNVLACCSASDVMNDKDYNYSPDEQTTEPTSPSVATPGQNVLMQPRAPVCLNTASEPVLFSVLNGIAGVYMDRGFKTMTSPGRFATVTLGAADARQLARDIITLRETTPLWSWEQFASFVNGRSYLDSRERSLVRAHANPNSRIYRFNPNRALGFDAANAAEVLRFGDLDKASLKVWTTEFSFGTSGIFEVESLGRVLQQDQIVAEADITAVVSVFDVVRHSTQAQFEEMKISSTFSRSHPHNVGNVTNLLTAVTNGSRVGDVDGSIQLAPLLLPFTGRFRNDFSLDLDAQDAGGSATARGPANDGVSLIDAVDPSELLADGVFCHETRRQNFGYNDPTYGSNTFSNRWDEYVRYEVQSNIKASAALEMWVKPTWDASEATSGIYDSRTFFSMGEESGFKWPSTYPDERAVIFFRQGKVNLYIGNTYGTTGPYGRQVSFVENFPAERGWYGPYVHWGKIGVAADAWKTGQWRHILAYWTASQGYLYVDGVRAENAPFIPQATIFPAPFPRPSRDWHMFLGHNRFGRNWTNGYPLSGDCTITGFRVYDGFPPQYSLGGFPCPDFYTGQQGAFRMRIYPVLSGAGQSGSIGSVAWTRQLPIDLAGVPAGYPDTAVSIEVTTGAGTALCTGDGSGYDLGPLPFTDRNGLEYEVRLQAPPTAARVETPILDDVTFTVLYAPSFLEYAYR